VLDLGASVVYAVVLDWRRCIRRSVFCSFWRRLAHTGLQQIWNGRLGLKTRPHSTHFFSSMELRGPRSYCRRAAARCGGGVLREGSCGSLCSIDNATCRSVKLSGLVPGLSGCHARSMDLLGKAVTGCAPMPQWANKLSDCMNVSRTSAFAETFRGRHSAASGLCQWT
jgi:hypothetical protein